MEQSRPLLRSEGKQREYKKHSALNWLIIVLEAGAAIALLFLLLLQPVRVSGLSMEPTLEQSEVLLIDRLGMFIHTPKRGDMVIFVNPVSGEELIKRVIAFAGETVELTDGIVYINGVRLDESAYITHPDGEMKSICVPDGAVFVLGDNRAQSLDSRDEALGCVPMAQLDGVVRIRVSPLNRINLFL